MKSFTPKNILLTAGSFVVLAITITALRPLFVYPVSAAVTAKVCGNHKGINCAAGAAYNGSVVCNDGALDDSALFSGQVQCKEASLKCPIRLSKDAYDKQKAALQTASDALTESNKNLCQDSFDRLEAYNKQLYDACLVAAGKSDADKKTCDKNKATTAANDKNNFDLCLKSAETTVAKYKEQMDCLVSVTDAKATTYGALGYMLPNLHSAISGSCSAYGPIATLNKSDARCYCPENWEWNSNGKYCVKSAPCQLGSSRVNGACVTYTKACINKYGVNSYGAALQNGGHECRCAGGFKMNSAKTACVAK